VKDWFQAFAFEWVKLCRYAAVAPSGTHKYSYSIVGDHMGGTHWYHAHFHGNTALQVGNGLVGLLVVVGAPVQLFANPVDP
jgi:FtsP/CotA-like multicopper oxidase with cupredoxin domain